MARRARQELRREVVILHLLNRDQARVLAVRPGGDHAPLADEHAAVRAQAVGAARRFILDIVAPREYLSLGSGGSPCAVPASARLTLSTHALDIPEQFAF